MGSEMCIRDRFPTLLFSGVLLMLARPLALLPLQLLCMCIIAVNGSLVLCALACAALYTTVQQTRFSIGLPILLGVLQLTVNFTRMHPQSLLMTVCYLLLLFSPLVPYLLNRVFEVDHKRLKPFELPAMPYGPAAITAVLVLLMVISYGGTAS